VGQKISILKKETAYSVSKGRNGREIFAQDAINFKVEGNNGYGT
jgi:hypothetical protein